MPTNTIIIGSDISAPLFRFSDHEIRSIEMVNGVDVVGTELSIDLLTPRVDYAYTENSAELVAGLDFDKIMSSDGYLMATSKTYEDLRLVPYGTLVRYFRTGKDDIDYTDHGTESLGTAGIEPLTVTVYKSAAVEEGDIVLSDPEEVSLEANSEESFGLLRGKYVKLGWPEPTAYFIPAEANITWEAIPFIWESSLEVEVQDLVLKTGLELVSKAYVQSVDRVAEKSYKVNAISAIGLLDTQKHYGNVYRGAKFPDVLSEIIGGAVPYTLSDELSELRIYGWLPYDTKRNNLHQLLFATGVMVARNGDGDMHFQFLPNTSAKQIPDGNIYMGGSVDYSAQASAVDVTEHSYMELETDEVVTEYDNTDGSETADNTFLVFQNAPLHDLETTGSLQVLDSGVNWAILSGTGILTGKKYTHSTRVMTRYAEGAENQRENVVTVSEAYLVNVANSENVAARILAYYSSKKTVSTAFVLDGEKAGDLVTGTDPYDEPISGFLSSMNSVVSTIIKVNAKIVTDYVPTGSGNNYTRAILLTGSGTFQIPAEVFEKEQPIIQAILIGGGHGGYSGEDGTRGTDGTFGAAVAGEGGAGGPPGEGGRVTTVTIDCTGLTSLVYSCGAGGESDSEGEATTIEEHSSATGAPLSYGVANLFTGEVYALAGTEVGTPGGHGMYYSPAPTVTYGGQTWTAGARGSNLSISYTDSTGASKTATAYGGYGGGPAVGANGADGENGERTGQSFPRSVGQSGRGGDGATPIAANNATGFGEGGPGGHGGGGGGEGGAVTTVPDPDRSGNLVVVNNGRNGSGGKGGKGGKGGPGLIIIYI